MKLGLACNRFSFSGGMENYSINLIKSFHQLGLPSPVVFAKSFDKSLPEISLIEPSKISTFGVPRILKDQYFSFMLDKQRRKHKIDVLLGCCRNTQSEIILCGGTHAGFLESYPRNSLYDKLCLSLEKKEFQNAQKIIAHSESVKKELIRLNGVDSSKIEVLYPPVDLSIFQRISEEKRKRIRESFGMNDKKISVLFVSSSHKRKGFSLLEEFFETTNLPVELFVAGRQLAKKNYKNIRYLGYLKNIQEAYQAADYSILASIYEPFGLAPIESLCSGTPVIISSRLGAAEIIKEDYKLEFRPDSNSSLGKAIQKAVEDFKFIRQRVSDTLPEKLFSVDLNPNYHTKKIILEAEKLK